MLVRYFHPAAPTLHSPPPRGEQWLHEIKFDGWRIQLHKHGGSAAAFTKNGHDHSSRVRWMVDALLASSNFGSDGSLLRLLTTLKRRAARITDRLARKGRLLYRGGLLRRGSELGDSLPICLS
jgi:ATP-dependent DNA ligase